MPRKSRVSPAIEPCTGPLCVMTSVGSPPPPSPPVPPGPPAALPVVPSPPLPEQAARGRATTRAAKWVGRMASSHQRSARARRQARPPSQSVRAARRGSVKIARALAVAAALAHAAPAAAEDLDGKPPVLYVVVPLCSNEQVDCGSTLAGRPGDLEHNLYWGAVFGARRFFERRAS